MVGHRRRGVDCEGGSVEYAREGGDARVREHVVRVAKLTELEGPLRGRICV